MLSSTYTEDRAGIIRYWIDDPFYPSPAIVGFIREHGCRIWDCSPGCDDDAGEIDVEYADALEVVNALRRVLVR